MTTRYRRDPDLQAVEMDGELMMMGKAQGEYFSLRNVAASIWHHLAEPRSVEELTTLVAAEYSVTPEPCRNDIARFLHDLVDNRMVLTEPR